jgi:outer membrane protein assembly factor BamB
MRRTIAAATLLLAVVAAGGAEQTPDARVAAARLTGGLVAQLGTAPDAPVLGLKNLPPGVHVRLLLPDDAAVAEAARAVAVAGLAGRFTVDAAPETGALPFADRVLDALIVAAPGNSTREEMLRALAPGGLLVEKKDGRWTADPKPFPPTIDDWTHFLYDASGNAVSKDKEVAPPKSFRWWAPPMHLRSHNLPASFTGLVTDNGRLFYFVDEAPYLFDKGGPTPRWALLARDAFNGALLWKQPLHGYGLPYFEDVTGQAVPDYVWRTPLSMNRRMVVQGDLLYVARHYRKGPLGILDAPSGETRRDVDLGGIVDEIVADGTFVLCRVRTEIPMPAEALKMANRRRTERELVKEGVSKQEARAELDARVLDQLLKAPLERVVAVNADDGATLWSHDAPLVAAQSLAMADGKVVYHNYQALVCLDAKTGEPVWKYDNPVQKRRRFGIRNMLGNLLIADGKVLWTSTACGGGVALKLEDGTELWTNPRFNTTGGFAYPTGRRVIRDTIYGDSLPGWGALGLSDGKSRPTPRIGGMLARGHHIRCLPGKATERYLILPQRGAEFIDLVGDEHMVNDWIRGACSYGLMPANGLTYVTPDPCSCYAGARIVGFSALAARLPAALAQPPAPDDPKRLTHGPARDRIPETTAPGLPARSWPMYRRDARRTAMAPVALPTELQTAWTFQSPGKLAQAAVVAGRAYLVNRTTYQLICLSLADGKTVWTRAFPAALDGPPTILDLTRGAPDADPALFLYAGCRDGSVYCLNAHDGAVAWRFLAAPAIRLTISDDRLEGLWPVSTSLLFHNGLIYAVAGRNSYLDGGIRLYALDPATGTVRHHCRLEGPWPDKETLQSPVITQRDLEKVQSDPEQHKQLTKQMMTQYATGYHMRGGQADLLVTDGTDLYMLQNKFTPKLEPVPLERIYYTGLTPMGGKHLMANYGFHDETMMHRSYWMYDEIWPGYGGGSGWAARAGNLVVVGEKRAYAAKHYTGGWYPTHDPGAGDRLVADNLESTNTSGRLADKETLRKFRQYGNPSEIVRTAGPVWETSVPIIIRSLLVAPDGQGDELVIAAGVVEGKTREDWDKSGYHEGPSKLRIHAGADGKLLAEYDLPACPVFDGFASADGRLLVTLSDGRLLCLAKP